MLKAAVTKAICSVNSTHLIASDQSGLAVRKVFDGSPEWIFDAMDPYLVTSRSTMSNVNARKHISKYQDESRALGGSQQWGRHL
ncbi:hypothetical protein BDZ89DRAFT_1138793 [Hymenopellis radicata]|nr:hypothetical protein BDZ89DRAFT_1138793 [Hymenopellis radicata]